MTKRPEKLSEAAAELIELRGIGDLAEKMGIEILELSAERSVATMPVLGNTQPLGVLHGGAHVVLGETLAVSRLMFGLTQTQLPWGLK